MDTTAQTAEKARKEISPLNLALYDQTLAAEEAKPLQERLNAAMDTTAQTAEKARKEISPLNLALYDQTLAAEEAKPLQERLNAAMDTTAQTAEKARKEISPLNLALYDLVLAAEASKIAMQSYKENVAGTVEKYNTTEVNKTASYERIAQGVRLAGIAKSSYSQLGKDLESASKDQIKAVVQQLYDGLGENDWVRKEALRGFADQLGDLKISEETAALQLRTKAQTTAMTVLERAVESEKKAAQVRLDLANENIANLKSIFELLKSNVTALYGEVESTQLSAAAQGNDFIERALLAARSTGYLPEKEALSDAIGASRKGLETTVYASQLDQDVARLELAGKLSQLKDIVGGQLTEAERQAAAAKAQLEYLDGVLAEAKRQVELLEGINFGVLSVADALVAFRLTTSPASSTTSSVTSPTATSATAASGNYRVSDYTLDAMIFSVKNKGEAGNRELYDWAYKWRDSGVTLARLNQVAGVPAGTAEEWARANNLPAFANGGDHLGGWAMVGEKGPELVNMPAGRVYNAPDTNRILNSSRGGDEALAALALEMARVVSRLDKLVASNAEIAETLEDVTESGNAMRIVTL
jgi:hypothetical protein